MSAASLGAAVARRCAAFKMDLINWRSEQYRSFLTSVLQDSETVKSLSSAAGFYHECVFLSPFFLADVPAS